MSLLICSKASALKVWPKMWDVHSVRKATGVRGRQCMVQRFNRLWRKQTGWKLTSAIDDDKFYSKSFCNSPTFVTICRNFLFLFGTCGDQCSFQLVNALAIYSIALNNSRETARYIRVQRVFETRCTLKCGTVSSKTLTFPLNFRLNVVDCTFINTLSSRPRYFRPYLWINTIYFHIYIFTKCIFKIGSANENAKGRFSRSGWLKLPQP